MAPPKKKPKNRTEDSDSEDLELDFLPRIYCREISKRIEDEIKTPMSFNELGEAISDEKCKWSSWVGKTARCRHDITYNDWRKVPTVKKQALLDECKVK